MHYQVIDKATGEVLAGRACLADRIFSRMKGLMFTNAMDDFDALIIRPCNSIHTWFMRYPIDAMFLNNECKIVKIKKGLRPWRITPIYFKATQVVEFACGKINSNLKEGGEVDLVCIN